MANAIPQVRAQEQETIRRASLVNRMEAVLLESLTVGYSLEEVQQAMDLAMDRWRAANAQHPEPEEGVLRFTGSHDLVLNALAREVFGEIIPGARLQLNYTGSLGGLIALAEGEADLAGCHLWDEESDTYNIPFVRRLLPGKAVTVVTLAHRRQGLIVAPGNPLAIQELGDLTRPEVRFVNRQAGSGTRVWLDAVLARQGIDPARINGYDDERLTHSDVARAVAEGAANAGLGLETAGRAYGLDFIFLNRERYDLVLLAETAGQPPAQQLLDWLASPAAKQFVDRYPGYESQETGQVQQVK